MNDLKPKKREPHRCARCAGEKVSVIHREDLIDFRGLTLEVDGLSETKCDACGFVWTTDGQERDNLKQLKDAFARERDAIRERDGLLSGEQIQGVLDFLHLSRAEASGIFGGGPNAFGKYVSGEVLQSFAMDRLLRLTLGIGSKAVQFLRLGSAMPLELSAAGYFVAPSVTGSTSSVVATQLLDQIPVDAMTGEVRTSTASLMFVQA